MPGRGQLDRRTRSRGQPTRLIHYDQTRTPHHPDREQEDEQQSTGLHSGLDGNPEGMLPGAKKHNQALLPLSFGVQTRMGR